MSKSTQTKKAEASCSCLTCAEAVDEPRRHDHLEGLGGSAEEHQHRSSDGHTVVQQEASFPEAGAAES